MFSLYKTKRWGKKKYFILEDEIKKILHTRVRDGSY